jgi:hypothetical protein
MRFRVCPEGKPALRRRTIGPRCFKRPRPAHAPLFEYHFSDNARMADYLVQFQLSDDGILCIIFSRGFSWGAAMGLRGTARPRRSFFVFIFGLVLSGCSIHPLPEDVTHVPIYTIVRQVRCETRQAVIESLFNYLTTRVQHARQQAR